MATDQRSYYHRHDPDDHGLARCTDNKHRTIPLSLLSRFMAVATVLEIMAHSLVLPSDAGQMLTDGSCSHALLAMCWSAVPPIDGIASVIVAAAVLKAGARLLYDSSREFLKAAPTRLKPAGIKALVVTAPHMRGVKKLHLSKVHPARRELSSRFYLDLAVAYGLMRADTQSVLHARLAMAHNTLQTLKGPPARANGRGASFTSDPPGMQA